MIIALIVMIVIGAVGFFSMGYAVAAKIYQERMECFRIAALKLLYEYRREMIERRLNHE